MLCNNNSIKSWATAGTKAVFAQFSPSPSVKSSGSMYSMGSISPRVSTGVPQSGGSGEVRRLSGNELQ